MKLSIEISV